MRCPACDCELMVVESTGGRAARKQKPSAARPTKRKKSAYQIWADKERPRIKKQHPRFSFGRVNKELGIRWKRHKRKKGMK